MNMNESEKTFLTLNF